MNTTLVTTRDLRVGDVIYFGGLTDTVTAIYGPEVTLGSVTKLIVRRYETVWTGIDARHTVIARGTE